MTSKDHQMTAEAQAASQESQGNNQNGKATHEDSTADADSMSVATCDNRKISREDIELVQNLIERCLQLYMNKGEVVRTLSSRARIEPGFTTLVWQKLEEENADFFKTYYIRLKLKKQIIVFNQLLEHQYHLMKYPAAPRVPLAPIQNGISPTSVNNLPMGYPVMPQHQMPAPAQPHMDATGIPNAHVVNGIPAHAHGLFHPMHVNTGIDTIMDNTMPEAITGQVPQSNAMPSMSAVSPASVASNNYFPFPPADLSLDTNFTSEVVDPGELQLGPDGVIESSRDTIRSMGNLWNLSLTDLTVDLTNLEDLGALGEYTGSPFLHSDSDILFDSPENNNMVEEYFVDNITTGGTISDEEKAQATNFDLP